MEGCPEKDKITEGRLATSWEEFYFQWGQETVKKNLSTQNDFLRHATTLNAALIGGGVALSGLKLLPLAILITSLICFLVALGAAVIGLLPYTGKDVDLSRPEEIRIHKEKATLWKTRFTEVVGGAMALGFLAAIAGLLFGIPK